MSLVILNMKKPETLEAFYHDKLGLDPVDIKREYTPFIIYKFEDCTDETEIAYSRRDFFKIAFMKGDYLYHYGDRTLRVSGSTLIFFNPDIPYTFEPLNSKLSGYFCIFRESFFNEHYRGGIRDLPMFMPGCKPSYALSKTHQQAIIHLFKKMEAELKTDYVFKYGLIRNYIAELMHFALKMQPSETLLHNIDANVRITAVFNELLERQFPIELNTQRLKLRFAGDFAERMAVHVNHLNRALKLTTGKTTTTHISERVTSEAKALLKHTDWNISEISFALGFEDTTDFNHFFKKQTCVTPGSFRS